MRKINPVHIITHYGRSHLSSPYLISKNSMRKWIALSKSIIFSFMIYMWFLGSTLLIKMDSGINNHESVWRKQTNWANNIKRQCAYRQNLRNATIRNNGTFQLQPLDGGSEEAQAKLLEAWKEKIVRDNLIFIPQLNQAWCLVPKAASTSWSYKIAEHVQSEQLNEDLRNATIPAQVTLRKHYGHISAVIFNDVLGKSKKISRVMLIRHPFSRLVSAFEDKLKNRKARSDSMYFYGHYGVKINRVYRKNKRLNKMKEPTFEEFVDYLVSTDPINYDEHWKPVSLLCNVCRIHYDVIIKQEEITQDYKYYLHRLAFNQSSNILHENENKQDHLHYTYYFRNITKEKLQKLREIYEDDFTFYDYHYGS